MMTETMYIGSGDCAALLSAKDSKAHESLMQRFVSGVRPYWNAKNSPIDALRGGAILEDAYYKHLGDVWHTQYKAVCKERDVLRSSLDFVRLEKGLLIEEVEMKSVNFDAFMEIPYDSDLRLAYIKKHYKNQYNQVQFQLLCTGKESMTFKQVVIYDSADDEANITRVFHPNEEHNTTIPRDEVVISLILERSKIFQQIKDCYLIKAK